MRITYAQLLDAANSMVAGMEVWVQAQQALAIETDIPAVAVGVCCGHHDVWVSSMQTRQHMACPASPLKL
jgi:O-succinylbenzoate synthase